MPPLPLTTEELLRQFGGVTPAGRRLETPLEMKSRFDALYATPPADPAAREAFLRRQGVRPKPPRLGREDGLDRERRRAAERLYADPMIGKGEPTSRLPGYAGVEIEARREEGLPPPTRDAIREEPLPPLPRRQAPPPASPPVPLPAAAPERPAPPEVDPPPPAAPETAAGLGEEGPGWWGRYWSPERRARVSGGFAGIADALLRNPGAGLGVVGAAMAAGAERGAQGYADEQARERQLGMMERRHAQLARSEEAQAELQRQKLEEERQRRAAVEAAIAQAPPELQAVLRAFPDKAPDLLAPQPPKVLEVGNQVVAVGPDGGARVLHTAPQPAMTPYQQAELDLRRRALEADMGTKGAEAELRRQELARAQEERERRERALAELPPEQRRLVELFGDKAAPAVLPREAGAGPEPKVVGAALVDPATGRVIYRDETKVPERYETLSTEEKRQLGLPEKAVFQRDAAGRIVPVDGAGQRGEELVAVQTPEGPRLLPRSQAAGMPPADTREAGAQFNQAKDLRTGFEKQAAGFRSVNAAYRKLDNALAQGTGAGDLAAIFAFMKALDPESVVREGEQELARRTNGPADWLVGYAQSLTGGGSLTPQTREQIRQAANSQVQALRGDYDAAVKYYTDLAGRYGIRPEDVITPVSFVEPPREARPPGRAGSANAAEAPRSGGAGEDADDLDRLIDEELSLGGP